MLTNLEKYQTHTFGPYKRYFTRLREEDTYVDGQRQTTLFMQVRDAETVDPTTRNCAVILQYPIAEVQSLAWLESQLRAATEPTREET